jgi:hypothetical protein
MRKLLTTGLLAATAAIAAPAYAAPTLIYTAAPNYGLPPSTTATIFQNFGTGAPNGSAYVAGSNETTSGSVSLFQGTVPGIAVDPTPSGGNYLAIGGVPNSSGTYTVTFNSPVQFFSFAFGSLDSYNSVTLLTAAGSFTYAGAQIIGGTATAPGTGPFNADGNSAIAGRVSFDFGGQAGLLSATFSSDRAAFEIDDLAAAVPEPASWAMMIAGFGMVGGALRSTRRRKTTVATA